MYETHLDRIRPLPKLYRKAHVSLVDIVLIKKLTNTHWNSLKLIVTHKTHCNSRKLAETHRNSHKLQ